ncbi:MAG: diaminopimelate epimerase [Flavobacteriia bacterium]|nr:diaminopimelate epimerase [Flavobacteriia bacterium]
MKFQFEKYQGTGNDFVMIDHRQPFLVDLSIEQIAHICHRRFGIGADGFILIEDDPEVDFKMVYFNSDGRESTMCGNGGRCSVMFAYTLGIIGTENIVFRAIDGLHHARIEGEIVHLGMNDVDSISEKIQGIWLDTGSPHHVEVVEDVDDYPVHKKGRIIRNEIYGVEGSNVNFIEWQEDRLKVRTYERGVEAETYSCGTGVTASAIAVHHLKIVDKDSIAVSTPGGDLRVSFTFNDGVYSNVVLAGPAQKVFEGSWID